MLSDANTAFQLQGDDFSWQARIVQASVAGVDYLFELRHADNVIATGHLNRELPLEIGDPIEVGGHQGIVQSIEPLLPEHEMRLVVQFKPDLS